jgi:hypothetical protein
VRASPRSCCRHFKIPRFITENLEYSRFFGPGSGIGNPIFGPDEMKCDFDLQEEFFCRNALKRLGAYKEDEDDEIYLLATAEDGNPIAQLEMAEM